MFSIACVDERCFSSVASHIFYSSAILDVYCFVILNIKHKTKYLRFHEKRPSQSRTHKHAHAQQSPKSPKHQTLALLGATALGGRFGQQTACPGWTVCVCMNAYIGVFRGVAKAVWYPHPSLPSQKRWVTGSVYSQAPSLCSVDTFFHSLVEEHPPPPPHPTSTSNTNLVLIAILN